MGNASSSRHNQDDSVDHGFLVPQGVYTGPQDWNHPIVANLIVERRLAPFYRPLEDYDPSWDEDRILAARKELPPPPDHAQSDAPPPPIPLTRPASKTSKSAHSKDISRASEAALYRNAVECPICFLYFPPNINRSRCCDHPICTECFVQIKRSEPTPTHLASDPACCPYCVQENFGVTYSPPQWKAGLGADSSSRSLRPEAIATLDQKLPDANRRKSFSADSPEVVTIDQIRPDWEAKLAAVRAAVQRRANRRIIMRQVGDRLIPVGVTSGRIHPIGQDLPSTIGENGAGEESGSRSRRRRGGGSSGAQTIDITQFLGLNGQDIEELMVMEAMRLSLQEHEAAQQKQAQDSNGNTSETATNDGGASASSATPPRAASTPLSFVLPAARAPTPQRDLNGRIPSETSSRARTPVGTPLIQSASSIALGLALPSSMRSSSPIPAARSEREAGAAPATLARTSPPTLTPTGHISPRLYPIPSSDDDSPGISAVKVRDGAVSPAFLPPSEAGVSDSYAVLPSSSEEAHTLLNGGAQRSQTPGMEGQS